MKFSMRDIVWVDFLHLDEATQIGPREGINNEKATYMVPAKERPMLIVSIQGSDYSMLKLTSQEKPGYIPVGNLISSNRVSYLDAGPPHRYTDNLVRRKGGTVPEFGYQAMMTIASHRAMKA